MTNLLSNLSFVFRLDRIPNVAYKTQKVSIPGIQLAEIPIPTPFTPLSNYGNLEYGKFSVTFKVDEDLTNYLEIFNWMIGLGFPDGYEDFDPARSDGSVLITNSSRRPIYEVQFTDMYPASLSDLNFDATLETMEYLDAEVTFNFDRMYINKIK